MRRPDCLHRNHFPDLSRRARQGATGVLPAAAYPLRRAAGPVDWEDVGARPVGGGGPHVLGNPERPRNGISGGGDAVWGGGGWGGCQVGSEEV